MYPKYETLQFGDDQFFLQIVCNTLDRHTVYWILMSTFPIILKELPVVYEEGDVEVDKDVKIDNNKEDVEEMMEQQGISGDTNEGT